MKYFKVKLNTQEIVVNDNSQSMFKSIDYMNKNYITKSKKNAFVMIMFAEDFKDRTLNFTSFTIYSKPHK